VLKVPLKLADYFARPQGNARAAGNELGKRIEYFKGRNILLYIIHLTDIKRGKVVPAVLLENTKKKYCPNVTSLDDGLCLVASLFDMGNQLKKLYIYINIYKVHSSLEKKTRADAVP
jgi:hypothetical protein